MGIALMDTPNGTVWEIREWNLVKHGHDTGLILKNINLNFY